MNYKRPWTFPLLTTLLLLILGCGQGAPVVGQSEANPYSAGVDMPAEPAAQAEKLPEVVLSEREKMFEKEIVRLEALEKENPTPPGQILFTGSSSIRKWNSLEEDMTPRKVVNRGFGGSIIRQVTAYAPRMIYPLKPDLIVLYCGENDIANDSLPATQPLDDFQDFVTLMRHHLPGTRLLFVSMKPSPARWKWWPKFQEANQLIEEWCQSQKDLRYLDVGEGMTLENGEVNPSIFVRDKLHMNAEGYVIWKELVGKALSDWESEP